MQETLLRRYSIMINGEETEPANVIERMLYPSDDPLSVRLTNPDLFRLR